MKKLLAIVLCLSMMLLCHGCGASNAEADFRSQFESYDWEMQTTDVRAKDAEKMLDDYYDLPTESQEKLSDIKSKLEEYKTDHELHKEEKDGAKEEIQEMLPDGMQDMIPETQNEKPAMAKKSDDAKDTEKSANPFTKNKLGKDKADGENADKVARPERPEREDKSVRPERENGNGRMQKDGKLERPERGERPEKAENGERGERENGRHPHPRPRHHRGMTPAPNADEKAE